MGTLFAQYSLYIRADLMICFQAPPFSSQGCSRSLDLEKMLHYAGGELCPTPYSCATSNTILTD